MDRFLAPAQIVSGIGGLIDQLRRWQIRPVMTQGIDRPVTIVRAEQQKLWHIVALPIGIRIDPTSQLLHRRIIHSPDQIQISIIMNLFALLAVHFLRPVDLRFHIQHVDHHRRDPFDPRVNRSRQPGGPAAFGSATHHESLDLLIGTLLRKLLHRVHGPDRAFDHREQQRPCFITALDVLIKCVGNQRILLFAAVKRLVGNLRHDGRNRSRPFSERLQHLDAALSISVAGDE